MFSHISHDCYVSVDDKDKISPSLFRKYYLWPQRNLIFWVPKTFCQKCLTCLKHTTLNILLLEKGTQSKIVSKWSYFLRKAAASKTFCAQAGKALLESVAKAVISKCDKAYFKVSQKLLQSWT